MASFVVASFIQASIPAGAVGPGGGPDAGSSESLPQLGSTYTLIGRPFYGQHGTFFMFQCNGVGGGNQCASEAEILAVNKDGITGWSDANGFRRLLSTPFYGQRATYADSLSDTLFAVNNEGIYTKHWSAQLPPDDGFGPTVRATTGPFYGNLATAFADVNGDYRADAIAVNRDGVFVKLARDGGTFGATQRWTSTRAFGSRGTYFADVNGDNRADLIMVNAEGTTVRMSTGSGFAPNGPVQRGLTAASRLAFGQLGGDSPVNVALWFSPSRVYAFPATATGFGSRQAVTSGPYFGQLETVLTPSGGGATHPYYYVAVVVNRSGIYAKRA